MNVYEYSKSHNITPEKAARLARSGRINARKLGFGTLGYWDIATDEHPFEPIDITITSKGLGGAWTLRARQTDAGFTLTTHNDRTGLGITQTFTDADDAAAEYRSHTFDPTRSAHVEPLTGEFTGADLDY